MLKIPLTPAELANMLPEDHPNNEPDAYATALNCFTQKNTEALVKCTRIALDAVKRRLQPSNRYSSQDTSPEMEKPPLFKAFIVLAIPTVVMRPSTEEIQSSVNRIVQNVLKMFEAIPQWSHIAQNQVCTDHLVTPVYHLHHCLYHHHYYLYHYLYYYLYSSLYHYHYYYLYQHVHHHLYRHHVHQYTIITSNTHTTNTTNTTIIITITSLSNYTSSLNST